MERVYLAWIVPFILFLSTALAAFTYNSSQDAVFAEPLQKQLEVERLVYVLNPDYAPSALMYMGIGGNMYTAKKVIEKELNITLVYPFGNRKIETQNSGYKYDEDDLYLVSNFQTYDLVACGRNSTSLNDIYNCTVEFNEKTLKEGKGNCRTSTSAFKLAFINSPIAANNSGADFKLMKAFVKDGYNAHRFIILSNKNGNFVIDPYWGIFNDLAASVKKNSDLFYNKESSMNYRELVYKVDYFYFV